MNEKDKIITLLEEQILDLQEDIKNKDNLLLNLLSDLIEENDYISYSNKYK